MTPIREWHDVGADVFRRDIAPADEPAVLRGVVRSWPAVQRGAQSPEAIAAYLAGLDNGHPVDAIMTPPAEQGRIFYNARFDGFNFLRNRVPVAKVLEQLSRYAAFAEPPSVAVQSAPIADCLPGFAPDNRLALLPDAVAPRIWIGNHIVTPAHFDESNNIACVVAGRRRFTLFPPEQIRNLYIGPLDFAPTARRSAWCRWPIPTSRASRAFARRWRPRDRPSWRRATRSTCPRCGGITSSRSAR